MKTIKIITIKENGKIEFTKDDLEKLLNEAYQDGYDDAKKELFNSPLYYPPGVREIDFGSPSCSTKGGI